MLVSASAGGGSAFGRHWAERPVAALRSVGILAAVGGLAGYRGGPSRLAAASSP